MGSRAGSVGMALACALATAACGQAAHPVNSTARSTAAPGPSAPRKLELGGAPIGLFAYAGLLWVADAQTNRVLRIDPGSNLVTGHVFVGKTPLRIAAFEGRLWSTDFDGGTITAVSPSTLRRVATVRVGPQPEGIVAFGSYLWVVSQQSGNLVGIAPGDAHPLTHVSVGNQPRQVAADAAHLWVRSSATTPSSMSTRRRARSSAVSPTKPRMPSRPPVRWWA